MHEPTSATSLPRWRLLGQLLISQHDVLVDFRLELVLHLALMELLDAIYLRLRDQLRALLLLG